MRSVDYITCNHSPETECFPFQNIVSATAACIQQLGLYAPHRNDVLFSFLPLAHTMERCAELAVYMAGGAVGFYSGAKDFKSIKTNNQYSL